MMKPKRGKNSKTRKWNVSEGIVVGLFFICGGLLSFYLDFDSFIEKEVETTAIVTDRSTHHGFNRYRLYVEYDVNGEKYETQINTSQKLFSKLKNGGTITIYYNPSNPSEAVCIDGSENKGYVLSGMLILFGIACFFIKE